MFVLYFQNKHYTRQLGINIAITNHTLRSSESKASGVLERCARPEHLLAVNNDKAVVADAADCFGELAALLAERLEIGFRKFAVGVRHKLDIHAAPALRKHV